MVPFRARFAAKRIANPSYYAHLSRVMAHPSRFYSTLALKLLPSVSKQPVDMRLKDGKTLRVRDFWTLFLFDEIFLENCYEAPEILKYGPFDTVIDVGANIGLFTLRSKQLWPDAHIIAVEPHPNNFQQLEEHININQLKDVESLQMGIAEKCGCFDLYLAPRNIAGHSMYKKSAQSTAISVPVSTLADVMAKNGAKGTRTLLKIDCEGCEYPLLSTLTQEIADRISCIIFEPEHSLYDLNVLLQKLTSLGFKTSKFSNLVVAARN